MSATILHSAVTPHGFQASFFITSTRRGKRQISATAWTLSNKLLHHLWWLLASRNGFKPGKCRIMFTQLKPNHFRPRSSWQCTQKLGAEISIYYFFVKGDTITLIPLQWHWLMLFPKFSPTLPKYQMITKSIRKHLISLCSTEYYPSLSSDSDWTCLVYSSTN